MVSNQSAAFAQSKRAYIIAPAGCGKTEFIALAVMDGNKGRELILTHTHAGVKALRDRMGKYAVPKARYRVDTIASWALAYAAHYPGLSGLSDDHPVGEAWGVVYEASRRVLQSRALHRVLRETYSGIYVDEYQDCTKDQHQLVMMLANLLPVRIVGDPLQGIFDFGGQKIVDWAIDIKPYFERFPDLTIPWRWERCNPVLGKWLLEFRSALLNGYPVDLTSAPLKWHKPDETVQRKVCFELARGNSGSAVAIHNWPDRCHTFARGLKGTFTSMEEMDCHDLIDWAKKIGDVRGSLRAARIIEFASMCMTVVSTELAALRKKLMQGSAPEIKHAKKYPDVVRALGEVVENESLAPVSSALRAIGSIPGRVLYRRELWREMARSLDLFQINIGDTLQEAAWHARNRTRNAGRRVELRTVSRTLLIKGLEFDHAVVLDAESLNAKNLYVAMTRGSRSLTVFSGKPVLQVSTPAGLGV